MAAPNRRQTPRHLTCTPAGVQSPEKQRVALLRDASSTGALLFSKSQFPIDTPLTITVRIDLSGENDVVVKGRVVRVEKLDDAVWTFAIGVTFIPTRDDLVPLFQGIAERQEKLFGKGAR